MKIIFFHHQYGNVFQEKSIKLLVKIAQNLKFDYEIIITDPKLESEKYLVTSHITLLRCSNANREFSGWAEAFSSVKNKSAYQLAVFTNDTIIKNRKLNSIFLKYFIYQLAKLVDVKNPAILGDVDLIRASPPYFFGSNINTYISTYLFSLNKSALNLINQISYDEQISHIFRKDFNPSGVIIDKYNTNYFQLIENWLYKPGDHDKWYQHKCLDYENFGGMMQKFKCIINEHCLSQKFIEAGGILIDFKIEFLKMTAFDRVQLILEKIMDRAKKLLG